MASIFDQIAARRAELGQKPSGILEQIAARRAELNTEPMASNTPDGRSVAPGTTESQAADVPEGMIYDERTGGYVDAALAAERMGKAQGAAASYLAGTPFIGEWVDEGMGQVDSLLTGRNPEIAQETMRQSRAQFQKARPGLATGLEVAGGVVGSLPAVAGGAKAVSSATTAVGKVGRAFGLGAIGGGTEGVVQGAGRKNDDRAGGALQGGVAGVAIGGLVGALSPLVGRGAQAVAKKIQKLDVKTIASEFGISNKAARIVKGHLINDNLDEAAGRLSMLGDDAMLADAGEGTAQLLDTAMQSGGRALKEGGDAVSARAARAGAALSGKLDDMLGPANGVKAAATSIAKRTSAARKAAYARAYAQPIDYGTGGAGEKVLSVFDRVPARTLKEAVAEANEAMQAAGVKNKQILVQFNGDAARFSELPNVQQLDEIKKALDKIGRESVDNFGRPTSQGIRARDLAKDLRDAVAGAATEYKAALRLGGDKIAEDQALDMGRKLLSRSTTFEDAAAVLRNASDEARLAAKRGLREQIEDTLSNVKRTITDPNIDAREAMQLVKDMSSRANSKKVALVLGKDSKSFFDELDKAEAALALRAAVSRNSATAVRQAGQSAIRDEVQPGLLRRTIGRAGNPLDAAREVSESLAGIDAASMSAAERGYMAEIATALTSIRGDDAQRALVAVRKALAGQPLRDEQANLIGQVVGSNFANLGYHASAQSLGN